jgi:hypothetical protein
MQFSTNNQPTTPTSDTNTPHTRGAGMPPQAMPGSKTQKDQHTVVLSGPNRVLNAFPVSRTREPVHAVTDTDPRQRWCLELYWVRRPLPTEDWPVSPPPSTPPPRAGGAGSWAGFPAEVLLRKEVIQPHLPVRLPCYDFVPIASPTFDGSPPYGLGHRLRVLPTFVT